MANLAKYPPPATPVAHHGFVVEPPAALGDPFTVRVPDFDDLHVFQITRWEYRGGRLPAVDDEVLVLVDDKGEPWVPAWWSVADPNTLGAVKGVVVHGAVNNVPRPGGFASVEWIGTVEPLNALDNDTWVNPA